MPRTHILLHVVGDARLGEALEHARVCVARAGAGGQRLGDLQARIDLHETSLFLVVRPTDAGARPVWAGLAAT